VQHIRAINAPAPMARLLGLRPGHAVLYITRISRLASGKAIEVTYSHCRSDHYDFVAELRREP
jgi:GntR family transcriptional regulator